MNKKGEAPDLRHFKAGTRACMAVFVAGILYAIITATGMGTLSDPKEPIGDPWFTLMELLTILTSLLMVFVMGTIHVYANSGQRAYSLTALGFMVIATGITSCNHITILVINHLTAGEQDAAIVRMLSFRWPSVAYILDIAAWDLFFPLAMLQASAIFKERKERTARLLMVISALFSLAGLIGVPAGNMPIRNIGIIGYAVFGPLAFLLIGMVFDKAQVSLKVSNDNNRSGI